MAAISGGDLRGILRFLDAAVTGTPSDPLPVATLSLIEQLIGADCTLYFEFRRADAAVLAAANTVVEGPRPDIDEAILAFGYQNPIGWRRWQPADGAVRLSAVIGRRELERLEYYDTVMRPLGWRDSLKVWLSSTEESVSCVLLDRFDADFTQRDADVMDVLHSHLIAIRESALAGVASSATDGTALSPREAQVLTWAARGKRNHEIARRLYMSPATVKKHLEHAYEKLGAHSRSDAISRLRQ